MSEKVDKYILNNGMVILGERMENVESAAFGFMIPAGSSRLPEGVCGAANIISDWQFRGAGDKDNKQLGDALDGLGLHRSVLVNSSHIHIGASLEAGNLIEAIKLYADIILRSRLDDEQFSLSKQLAMDSLVGLDDDPRQKVMLKVREKFYPEPLGRSTAGEINELKSLTAESTKKLAKEYFNPSEMIFSVAGKFDFEIIVEQLTTLFKSDVKKQISPVDIGKKSENYTHILNESAQVHIGLMTETVKPDEKDYYNARMAISILSGGMSARLFTEVREKRGLCYAIGAKYHCLKEAAGVMCYAGTTPDKAQETIEVITKEFNHLSEGISEEEIERAKAGLKSILILSSESTSSRASSLGGDYYMLGRIRSLEEIKKKIDSTSVDTVEGFVKNNPFKDFTIVTIGPQEVKV